MRFVSYETGSRTGLALEDESGLLGLNEAEQAFPGTLDALVAAGRGAMDRAARVLREKGRPPGDILHRPPLAGTGKIICVGLNYRDHSAESGYAQPTFPAVFGRFASSLIGHRRPMVRPSLSHTLDFEGELVAVIGKPGYRIAPRDALDHVAGYSIFNDGSVREYQHLTPQWTVGKNFDATGAFGPAFVTADELPAGCAGLRLETRLNGRVVQSANIDDMVFGVVDLVVLMSRAMTLYPGDLIVTGTPSGVGGARKPPLFMQPGDVCEVEIEGIGVLASPVVAEADEARAAA